MKQFKRTLQTLGFYWQEMDPEEYRSYEGNQDRIDDLFDVLAKQRLAEWVALAEERLEGTSVRAYLCGGNDDTDEVLSALDEAPQDRVVNAENRAVPIDDEHVVVTVGLLDADAVGDTPRGDRTRDRRGDREDHGRRDRSLRARSSTSTAPAGLEPRHVHEARRVGLATRRR